MANLEGRLQKLEKEFLQPEEYAPPHIIIQCVRPGDRAITREIELISGKQIVLIPDN